MLFCSCCRFNFVSRQSLFNFNSLREFSPPLLKGFPPPYIFLSPSGSIPQIFFILAHSGFVFSSLSSFKNLTKKLTAAHEKRSPSFRISPPRSDIPPPPSSCGIPKTKISVQYGTTFTPLVSFPVHWFSAEKPHPFHVLRDINCKRPPPLWHPRWHNALLFDDPLPPSSLAFLSSPAFPPNETSVGPSLLCVIFTAPVFPINRDLSLNVGSFGLFQILPYRHSSLAQGTLATTTFFYLALRNIAASFFPFVTMFPLFPGESLRYFP